LAIYQGLNSKHTCLINCLVGIKKGFTLKPPRIW